MSQSIRVTAMELPRQDFVSVLLAAFFAPPAQSAPATTTKQGRRLRDPSWLGCISQPRDVATDAAASAATGLAAS
jgi:hypothetical protein